jgi:hypothetical protein
VFLEENQCVVFWGVEVGTVPEDDPPVYQAEYVRGRPTEWYLEHKRCSEFLIVMLHLQAVWAGYDFLGGSVGRGQKLSHYRGQIESPASLPGGVTVGFSGK